MVQINVIGNDLFVSSSCKGDEEELFLVDIQGSLEFRPEGVGSDLDLGELEISSVSHMYCHVLLL